MNINYFKDLIKIGLKPFPIIWDAETKGATSHIVSHSHINNDNWNETSLDKWVNEIDKANGIALKLFPPFAMLDFDLKNTDKKDIYHNWLNIISNTNDSILSKLCIEKTRNNGYHVYIKYPKLTHKIQLAATEQGAEVIAVYTGGLVSYCTPTPGYELVHNDFEDIAELTDDEYDLLTSTASLFNEYKVNYNDEKIIINYPIEYENTCLQFDTHCTDDVFEQMLNDLTLFEVRNFRYGKHQKFAAYLRKGSTAKYSAKVYFKSKKLLLFTTSLAGFPTWQDAKQSGDHSWILTPSRILYYKNNRDWHKTIEDIECICDSANIEIEQNKITEQPIVKDRMQFPYDIFPEHCIEYINCFNIQPEYLAASMLAALNTAIGNTAYLKMWEGYNVKPILYLALVAPAGSAKSPAIKIAFQPLEDIDNEYAKTYFKQLNSYNELLNEYEKDRKNKVKPNKHHLQQNIVKDATIETVGVILNNNPKGCILLADELIGFLNRMNAYKTGDDMEKWLEMWDGSTWKTQRLGRELNMVFDYTMNVFGGVQPGVLNAFSKGGNEFNGFYHRFCFVYPELLPKPKFEQIQVPAHLKEKYFNLVYELIKFKDNDVKDEYMLNAEAMQLYSSWYDYKSRYYNSSTNDNVKGIISKYQGYCLRFALIIQVINDGAIRTGFITANNMEKAIRLTEYFFGNMNKALNVLQPETPVDVLKSPYDAIYKELEPSFSTRTAVDIAKKYKVKEAAIKMFIYRNKDLFIAVDKGNWEKKL